MKGYLNLFDFSKRVDYKTEILAWLTVALALIPEAVAFSILGLIRYGIQELTVMVTRILQ